MIKRTMLALILLITIFSLSVYAEPHEEAGTAGLAFLKISAGARATGMGEAFTAIADDATATYWNPAGLTFTRKTEASFTHNEWIQDVRHEFLSGVINNDKHAFGLNIIYLTVGDIERRETTGEAMGTFSAYDLAVSLSYANKIMENLSLGVTAKMLYSKIHFYEAKGFGADLGLLYAPKLAGYLKGLRLGAVAQNLGPKMKFEEEEFDLPMRFKVGGAYPIYFSEDISALLAVDGVIPNDNDFKIHTGVELAFRQMAFLRAGYKANYETSGITIGAGFMIQNYMIDYAFAPYSDDLGNPHRISLGVKF